MIVKGVACDTVQVMEITYTDEKKFTKEQTQRLFRSVGWVSGEYPERLYKALMGSVVAPDVYWRKIERFVRRTFRL